ncbi:transposase [Chloroflexota bacterium]
MGNGEPLLSLPSTGWATSLSDQRNVSFLNGEGFWNLLKRGIGGVFHSVSEKHLQSYINENGFRYNHRKDEKPMFLTVLEKV